MVWLGKTGRVCTIGFDKFVAVFFFFRLPLSPKNITFLCLLLFRGSQREIKVFEANNLSKPIATQVIDVSPSVLVPYYDEDTSVLFLWGRVSNSIFLV